MLLPLAALIRMLAPALAPDHYAMSIAIAGSLWLGAFVAILAALVPILLAPRADGRPG